MESRPFYAFLPIQFYGSKQDSTFSSFRQVVAGRNNDEAFGTQPIGLNKANPPLKRRAIVVCPFKGAFENSPGMNFLLNNFSFGVIVLAA
ncbi:MAG: hypothetical protein AB1656_04125 [Candidatus Omnitrophota bacterium]